MFNNFFEDSLSLALTPDVPERLARSCLPLPHQTSHMAEARAFVAGLARAGKVFKEIKIIVDAAYGVKTLQQAQIYRIIKLIKDGEEVKNERGRGTTKRDRDAALIAAVAAAIEEDGRVSVRELASANGVSNDTIHKILHDELGLSKKSARWVPKLLSQEQKEKRVELCKNFIAAVHRHSMSYLDTIVTMDETMVSLHTPETKKQSKRWVKRGQPGPLKARVQASRSKTMILAFFDARGLIYTNVVPKGETVNAAYIVKALGRFMVKLREKRPQLAENGFVFHWDNAPVHTAAVVRNWFADNAIPLLEHPAYSPDLAPADFFLFPKVKEALAGITIAADGVKNAWDGVTRTIAKEAYAAAFQRWFERSQKCVRIGGGYVEKT